MSNVERFYFRGVLDFNRIKEKKKTGEKLKKGFKGGKKVVNFLKYIYETFRKGCKKLPYKIAPPPPKKEKKIIYVFKTVQNN